MRELSVKEEEGFAAGEGEAVGRRLRSVVKYVANPPASSSGRGAMFASYYSW